MDCARNIITANFSGGGTSATTAPLWQWDYGQALCITGIDLPAAFEVHFSTNRTGGVSTVAVGADGQATIPNDLLTIGKNLNAWIYLSDSEGEGETEYSITIPVKARPMPETYDAEVSGEFDDVVRQVSEYAQAAQTAADNAGASASAAATSASEAAASASAAETAKNAAETAQGKAEDAQAAAETAAQTATEKAQQTAQDAAQTAQSKADAESAAGRAEAAETGAESAKTDAETAAQGAAASASTATEKANLAGQAATSAAQSATAAAQSAASIEGDVQTATQKAAEATVAAGQAVAAKDAAQTAQQGAEAAETNAGQSASTATTKAAEAAQSASNAAASETAAEAAATRAEQAAATLTVDSALSDTSVNPVENRVITAEVTHVKSALPNTYVALAGENQVTPQNIAGMQFTKTEGTVDGENIFSADMLFREGQYVISYEGTVSIGSNASVNAYCVPVEQNSTYVFPECRFAVLATGNTVNSTTVGDTITYASQVETSNATYLFLSYADKPVSEITVKKRETTIVYSDFILPDWLKNEATEKPKFVSTTGNLSDGTFLALLGYKQNLRKGERYVFSGNVNTISTLTFGFTYASAFSATNPIFNAFIIDSTNVTYKTNSQNANYDNQYAHGLTLTNNIQFIFEYLPEGNAKITLLSNGVAFTQTLSFIKKTISQVVVLSTGSTLTNCKLTWTPIDIDKSIWMFGDSYFAYSSDRWTYYLQQYGYAENALIDGFPGEGSVNARNSLMTLIQFGTPKYIVWCMGMNDGSDTDASTPSSDWTVRRDEMLTICNNNGITPIFATIPNVPSILNTGKNAWIKASGYRYIDFAAAVGAESAGSTWFTGMLSSDNVHPSESGAKALFARVLVDFPEIMLND